MRGEFVYIVMCLLYQLSLVCTLYAVAHVCVCVCVYIHVLMSKRAERGMDVWLSNPEKKQTCAWRMVCIHSVATASVLALIVNHEVRTRYCVRTRTRNDPASSGWSTRDEIW